MSDAFQPPALDRKVSVNELELLDSDRGSMWFDPAMMGQAWRAAQLLASSKLVPDHFHKDPASVYVALVMARERGENALLLMQSLYMVKGRPGWMTEYLIARCRQQGIDLRWMVARREAAIGDLQDVTVTCYQAGDTDEDRRTVLDTRAAIRAGWTSGSGGEKYKQNTERMLRWRTASWWISMYASEIKHGLPTIEDLEEPVEGQNAELPKRGMAAMAAALDGNSSPASAPDSRVGPEPTAGEPPEKETKARTDARVAADAEEAERLRIRALIDEWELSLRADEVKAIREGCGVKRVLDSTPSARLQVLLTAYVAADAEEADQKNAKAAAAQRVKQPVHGGHPASVLLERIATLRDDLGDELFQAVLADLGIPALDGCPEPMLEKLLAELEQEFETLEKLGEDE